MATSRVLPTLTPDSTSVATPTRTDSYGGAFVIPVGSGGFYGAADEGSYFTISNATVATGIAGHAAPVVADTDTKALLHIYNGAATKSLVFDFLNLEVTAAGTGGTLHYAVVYTDNKGSTALSSGGTTITPSNVKSNGAAIDSGVVVTFGAAVLAMTSSKKLGQQIVREVIPVVQDTITLKFGAAAGQFHAGLTTAGTATAHVYQSRGPVSIGPGGNLNVAMIRPAQSAAASYQFVGGFWLR